MTEDVGKRWQGREQDELTLYYEYKLWTMGMAGGEVVLRCVVEYLT